MELIRDVRSLQASHRGCVATIGTFDGIHLGHQAVLRQVVNQSMQLKLPSVVIVFEPLPGEYLSPTRAPARLMSFREKFYSIDSRGIDRLLTLTFNEKLKNMSANQFVEDIFVNGLGVEHLVFGDDFRFGNNREGDISFTQRLGKINNFAVVPTSTVEFEGERISSTRIRQALAASDFILAKSLLGRSYSISGRVVFGRQMGRTLGFPTANIELGRLSSPLSGVYAVKVNGPTMSDLRGVANIGVRPTVNDNMRANLEVHLLDFDNEIYGQRIDVTFLSKIREEKKFSSLDELKVNIANDLRTAQDWFDSNPLLN